MDFTLPAYHHLLSALLSEGFFFQTFAEFLTNPKEKVIILRQISEIHALGYEIGYQYETMETASKNFKFQDSLLNIQYSNSASSLIDADYSEFCKNLEQFRKIVPVETICVHGSPLSKFDNRDI